MTPEKFLNGGDFKVVSADKFLGGGGFKVVNGDEKPGFVDSVKSAFKKRVTKAAASQVTYDALDDINIKKDYLDWANLYQLEQIGVKAISEAKFKGGFGSFWSGAWDMTTTPIKTIGGRVLYRVGDVLEFIGEKGIKRFGDFLELKGFQPAPSAAAAYKASGLDDQRGFVAVPGKVTHSDILKDFLQKELPKSSGKFNAAIEGEVEEFLTFLKEVKNPTVAQMNKGLELMRLCTPN